MLVGCASYSEKLLKAREATAAGRYQEAIVEMNDVLDVSSQDENPAKWKGDQPLAALERGSLLQAIGQYQASAHSLSGGEEEIQLLDLSPDAAGKLGKYIYSDSAGHYASPPAEQLSLNAVNMLNYLALGDLAGAGVEARRYTVLRDYLETIAPDRTQSPFGSYLCGLVFEKQGESDRALRYYDEVLTARALPSLDATIVRLARIAAYRSPRINAILERSANSAEAKSSKSAGEIITVFSLGRVPYKVPKRIPIGAAIGIAGTYITGDTSILSRSIFKVVVYPELHASGSLASGARVQVDGRTAQLDLLADIGKELRKEYADIKPRIIGAALSRMIARAVVAEGARQAGQQGGGVAGIVGLLAGLAAEGTMVGLDTPDTRSWNFLAQRIFVTRAPVAAGKHDVDYAIEGDSLNLQSRVQVDVPAGGYAIVVVTTPR